jgi:hypothetical protein
VLYDVITLYFETDKADGFREPGFSKERRLEPQITVGQLTDVTGFPLMVEAFEGNKAETRTMLPAITSFMTAHQPSDVRIVADAGLVSEANREAIEDARLSYVIGTRIPETPYVIKQWRRGHPDGEAAVPEGRLDATHPDTQGVPDSSVAGRGNEDLTLTELDSKDPLTYGYIRTSVR